MARHVHGELVRPGQNLPTAAVPPLGGNRQLTLRGGVAPTHVVVDVTGFLA